MVIGICRVTLMIPEAHSLKEKRMVLRRIKDRVRNHFNCAIAEVDLQDEWQTAQIGFTVVSNEYDYTYSHVQRILTFIEDLAAAKISRDEQDFIHYGDEPLQTHARGK